jgi:hypothetical protein
MTFTNFKNKVSSLEDNHGASTSIFVPNLVDLLIMKVRKVARPHRGM